MNHIKAATPLSKYRSVFLMSLPFLVIVQVVIFKFKLGVVLAAIFVFGFIALVKPGILYLLLISLLPIESFSAIPGVSYTRIFGILVALALALRLALRKKAVPDDDSYKYYFLFFLGSIVSFAFARDIALSLTTYATYISLFMLYVVTRYFLQSMDDADRALNFIFVSTLFAFLLAYTLGLSAGGHDALRVSGGIGDPNEFASFILVLIPLAIYRLMSSSGLSKVSYLGCLTGFLLLLVYSGSRGGVLGFLGMAGTLIFYYGTGKVRQLLLLIFAAATISYFLVPEDYWTRASSIMHSGRGKDRSIEVRIENYEAAVDMFLDNPLAGVGLRNFHLNSRKYGATGRGVVHNTYLEILTGGGLLSFVPFALILINAWRKLRLRRHYDDKNRDFLICLKASFVSLLITSFFISAENKKILWFLFALISSAYYMAKTSRRRPARDVGPA